MSEAKEQILDVNHFDNTVVVKFEDGKIALLNGAALRHAEDAVPGTGNPETAYGVEGGAKGDAPC